MNYLPTGILKQVQEPEYCEMYEEIKKFIKVKEVKLLQMNLPKKYKG